MGKNKKRLSANNQGQNTAADAQAAPSQASGVDFVSNLSEDISTVTDPAMSMSMASERTELVKKEPAIQQDSEPVTVKEHSNPCLRQDQTGEATVSGQAELLQSELVEAQRSEAEEAHRLELEQPSVAENATSLTENGEDEAEEEEKEEPLPEYYDEKTIGTPYQKVIVKDYPMKTPEQKLKVPYIERFNGNLCVQAGKHQEAVAHYNKSLLSLKMLFQMDKDPVVSSQDQAVKLIQEIELIVCANLAHCYVKLGNYHHAIKYASQVLEKDPKNKKALFRMGVAYTNINELEKARESLNKVLELEGDEDMKKSAELALKEVDRVEKRNQQKESQMLKRMFTSAAGSQKEDGKQESDQVEVEIVNLQEEIGADSQAKSPEREEAAQATVVEVTAPKSKVQLINEWILWTVFLPITLPLELSKYSVRKSTVLALYLFSLAWSAFCVWTLFLAAVLIYVPLLGEQLAWLCLMPTKIDRFPQQPFVRLAIDVLKISLTGKGQKTEQPKRLDRANEVEMADRKGEN